MVVMKLRLLRWEIISACPDGTKVITRILTSRRKERESQRESEMGRADGSRVRETGHKPRTVGNLQNLEKSRKQILA